MNIIINCGPGDKVWHHGSYSGGSEEQTILLSDLLVDYMGASVSIFNSVKEPTSYKTVRYFPACHFNETHARCDVYFGWRNPRLFEYRYAPIQILLCHDIPVPAHFPTRQEIALGALTNIDYVCVLNDYHRELYYLAGCPPEKLITIPIVIKPNPYIGTATVFRSIYERDLNKCIWPAHPNRGLHKLTNEYWPEIKRRAPHATLQPVWWDRNDEQYFVKPNKALGILPTKILNHDELDRELACSYLFPYCCEFDPEISPASCLKALNAECDLLVIPKGGVRSTLTSNIADSKVDIQGRWHSTNDIFVDDVVRRILIKPVIPFFYPPDTLECLQIRRPERVAELWKKTLCCA